VLDASGLRARTAEAGSTPALPRFCSTSDGEHLRQLASTLLGLDAPVERVHVPSRRTVAMASQAA
jgi:glutamate racemase